jgi:hypothetical protein
MQYGQSHMGVAPSMLHAQRTAAMAVISAGARGRDMDLSMIVADTSPTHHTDPAFAAHIDPIVKWAQAVWQNWLPRRLMNGMVAKARTKLAMAKRVWQVVKGPAAATVATAARLGWTMHDATSATTDEGRTIDFDLDPPSVIARLVADAVRRWQWRRLETRLPATAAAAGQTPPVVLLHRCVASWRRIGPPLGGIALTAALLRPPSAMGSGPRPASTRRRWWTTPTACSAMLRPWLHSKMVRWWIGTPFPSATSPIASPTAPTCRRRGTRRGHPRLLLV